MSDRPPEQVIREALGEIVNRTEQNDAIDQWERDVLEALAALLAEKERRETEFQLRQKAEAENERRLEERISELRRVLTYYARTGSARDPRFARFALSGDAATEEQRSKKLSKSEQRLRCFTEERT